MRVMTEGCFFYYLEPEKCQFRKKKIQIGGELLNDSFKVIALNPL